MAQSYTSPPSMSQRLRSLLSRRTPEAIEPSGVPKDHRISAHRARIFFGRFASEERTGRRSNRAKPLAQNANTELCPRCFSIEPKIRELLSLDPESLREGERTVLELQSADDLFQSPSCPLCQALKFICPKIWVTDRRCPARLVVAPVKNNLLCVRGNYFDEHEHKDNRRGNSGDAQHLCLTLAYFHLTAPHRETIEKFDARQLYIEDAVGYLAEKPALEQNPETAFADSLPALVDFKLLQQWLESSEREGNFIEGTHPVRNLMVIDCESGKIIKAPSAKYVALSYVWGQEKPKEEELEEIDGCLYLKRRLENTIEDALTVTRQLNLRYLWVDRYCIPQDDFKYQISKMHEIYGGAHVTIIAAAGNGPQHGLPGVNQTRRTRPPPVTIGSRTLLATFPSPKLLVEESKWHSRGWTFQEGLLSRRRLVFTDHQVFFHCDNFLFLEAFRRCLPRGFKLKCEFAPPFGPLFSFASAGMSRRGDPWDRIAQYSTLDLTNPEDTLNGILGVLNYYQEESHTPSTMADATDPVAIRHITGLPISRRTDCPLGRYEPWEDTIICALFWKSKRPGDRRKPERMPFPSWSWAGWKCDCYFGSLQRRRLEFDVGTPYLQSLRRTMKIAQSQNKCLPSILIETEESESLLQAAEYETMFDEMHDFSKIRYLHVTALTVDARIVAYNDRQSEGFDWWELDNTGRKFALECGGAEKQGFLNLTSDSIYQQPMPPSGHPCLAIILDFDPDTEPTEVDVHWTFMLVVSKTEDCYERIGVAYIEREALRKAHVKKQEDIKLG